MCQEKGPALLPTLSLVYEGIRSRDGRSYEKVSQALTTLVLLPPPALATSVPPPRLMLSLPAPVVIEYRRHPLRLCCFHPEAGEQGSLQDRTPFQTLNA